MMMRAMKRRLLKSATIHPSRFCCAASLWSSGLMSKANSTMPRSKVREISAALAWPSVVPFRIMNCQIFRLAYSAVDER